MKKIIILTAVILSLTTLTLRSALADADTRQKIIERLRSVGMSEKLDAGVNISADNAGILRIEDQGDYLMQYIIMDPNVSADPNLIIDPNLKFPTSANKIVITTHGYIDKAESDWPNDIANQLKQKTDPNQWICGFFDWRGGAAVINPIDAAKYGKCVGGPRLARAILKLRPNPDHVHLIAHSAGCWTINSAAKIIAQKTNAQIHLTFLDAYVPPSWDQAQFGKFDTQNTIWAEHYYTKDLTFKYNQTDLTSAHNIDITAIDLLIKEHEFPYRWYYATIAGKYRKGDWEARDEVITDYNGLDYGFARSAEAGQKNWQKTLTLEKGNKALKLKKPKKKKSFNLNIFKKKEKNE